jgi:tetratricopeptide (TPR) repeat protein
VAVAQYFANNFTRRAAASRRSQSEGVDVLREQLRQTPADVDGWVELADRLEELGDLRQATEAIAEAARLALEAGEFGAASALLERSIGLTPQRAESHYELAKTHHQLGRFAAALQCYGRAYEHFLSTQRRERSKEVLERMIRLKPDDIELQIERARNLEADGEFKDALEIYRRCAEELERSGSTQEFLELSAHMLELAPEQPKLRAKVVDALLAESEAYNNYGLDERAYEALQEALAHAPDSLEAHLRLVLFCERRRQSGPFLEAVEAMARQAKGGRGMAARHLQQARQWLEDEERIDELAEQLEISVNDTTQELPSVPGEVQADLGDEETAPREASRPAFLRESTRNHGVLFGGGGRADNLLALLQCAERIGRRSKLLVEDGQGTAVAEFHVRDGRIEVGMRRGGQVYVDKSLERVSADLAARLRATEFGEGVLTSNTTTGERSQLYRLTARAILELAQMAESQHFCLRSRQLREHGGEELSFSPVALVMCAAGYMHSDSSSPAARFYQEMSDSSDEACLLVAPGGDSTVCLPVRAASATGLTIGRVRQLGQIGHELLQYNRKIGEGLASKDGIATSFAMVDGCWSVVSSGAMIVLVRNESHKIGTTLSRARRVIEHPEES